MLGGDRVAPWALSCPRIQFTSSVSSLAEA
jgi:hypothetical protein